MSVSKYDYVALEREFITGTMSVRELCKTHEINSWSTVHVQAKKRDWVAKRAAFQAAESEKVIDKLAQKRADKVEQIVDDAVDIIHRAAFKFMDDISDREYEREDGTKYTVPGMIVSAADLAKLIDKLLLLTGRPTAREEHIGRTDNFNLNADVPLELFRELRDAARAAGAGARSVGSSPLPLVTGPRSVN